MMRAATIRDVQQLLLLLLLSLPLLLTSVASGTESEQLVQQHPATATSSPASSTVDVDSDCCTHRSTHHKGMTVNVDDSYFQQCWRISFINDEDHTNSVALSDTCCSFCLGFFKMRWALVRPSLVYQKVISCWPCGDDRKSVRYLLSTVCITEMTVLLTDWRGLSNRSNYGSFHPLKSLIEISRVSSRLNWSNSGRIDRTVTLLGVVFGCEVWPVT